MPASRLLFGLALLLATAALLWQPYSTPTGTDAGVPLRQSLPQIPLVPQRTTVLGYHRPAFGPGWASAGRCSTREAIAQAQFGSDAVHQCRIIAAGPDPYSGAMLDPSAVEIDHIFPLSAAWDMGAYAWSEEQRRRFANDPLNLVAVSQKENRRKSDQLPSRWLPSHRASRCWYARRLAQVAAAYDLPLPRADAAALRAQCRFREPPTLSLG
ncbi:HNH endonuclease [Corynebacterium sp. zg-331]|uniref:HNH endonuclease family protein n=1 Tax=unclassified Corynebacterium TaxID=2624378 RepID=UPI00128D6066|nr:MULTISPECIES: HNH endonuclease family protein [unclassified Corynebacterium]MBC3186176.1 HNH endonuclease [Corynebacterium sp. zg-331]MPV52664.1 DUF1524 domain-containing protein [Corynebacterium sp. zg331]